MIIFPNCKINLGLQVLRKRADGYHDLQTVFYPVPLQDSLELIADPTCEQELVFTQSGLSVDAPASGNLCVKAFELLKMRFPQIPNCRLHLHKVIPMGGGLGGGSADAAFTLQLVNNRFRLGLSTKELLELALLLGSDCPFFIINQPCLATGRGEVLMPVTVDLSGYTLVLVCPPVHVATPWAYKAVTPVERTTDLVQFLQSPVDTWTDNLVNDFQGPVFGAHPILESIHQTLYGQGAIYSAMSGSGSVVFGIFKAMPGGMCSLFPSMQVYIL